MRMVSFRLGIVFAGFILASHAHVASAQVMYWTDPILGAVSRTMTDGSNRQELLPLPSQFIQPTAIAIDRVGGKVYWSDFLQTNILRSNLDGSARELIISNAGESESIAIEIGAQKLYWAYGLSIRRSDLDGQNVEVVINLSPSIRPTHIVLNPSAGHIYFSGFSSGPGQTGAIYRVNFDASGLTPIVAGLTEPRALALDAIAGKLYWADSELNVISRASVDGTQVETVISGDLEEPEGVALDVHAGKLYWTELRRIRRANMDGSQIETLISDEIESPRNIALDVFCSENPDNTPCVNLNECDVNDRCIGTACVGTAIPGSCDDGDACTINDVCTAGVCAGIDDPVGCFKFFLMVTKVNGVVCPSCPTVNLPVEEVRPGDVITLEAYMENWKDVGLCNDFRACSVSAQDCPKVFYCLHAPSLSCTSSAQCPGFTPCVTDPCTPQPRLAIYEWGPNMLSLTSGSAGYLSPYEVPCSGNADCRHDSLNCTCGPALCTAGACEIEGSIYIDAIRPDFVYVNGYTFLSAGGANPFAGAAGPAMGTVDPGYPVYLGTLDLKSSPNAQGTFTVSAVNNWVRTYTGNSDGYTLKFERVAPVTINFCSSLEATSDCNSNSVPDECEVDTDADGMINDCDPCPQDPLNQCPAGIPSASSWGMLALALMLLLVAKITFSTMEPQRKILA